MKNEVSVECEKSCLIAQSKLKNQIYPIPQ